jgi:hypothetical protein
MKSNTFTLKTILLGIFTSLSITMFAGVDVFPISTKIPAIPQVKAEEDNEDGLAINSGGEISENETLCGMRVPAVIKNVIEPTGEVEGFLVLQWEKKEIGGDWEAIPGANGLDYESGEINITTLYRRGCREASDQPWIYSNIVSKKVVEDIQDIQMSATMITCKGGDDGTISAAVAGGTPGYTFDWIFDDATGNLVSGVTAGFYAVTVTDQNGCTYTSESVEVIEPTTEILIYEILRLEPNCPGYENGAIFVDAHEGVEPYTFSWSNGTTGSAILDIPAGSYAVTVTDAIGCSVTETDLTITQPDAIQLHDQSIPATCYNIADASAVVTAVGGTPPYNYIWPNGSYGEMKEGLSAGTYTVDVIDYNGCLYTEDVTILQPDNLVVSPYIVNNKICKASANLVPEGGTAPYTYEWEDGTTASLKMGLCPGVYTIEVTDNKGCRTSETLEIQTELVNEDISISVIVNPFHLEGDIIIKLPFDDNADVRIYSPTGQLVQVFMHQEAKDNHEIKLSLDLKKYSNGVYIVEVLSGGLSASEKIMVSN